MLIINCKVELKLFFLSAGGTENVINEEHNTNYINFAIKDTKLYSCCNFISKRQSKTIKTF